MPTLFDYLHEHGNKTLDELPFNEVDAAILCQLAHLPLVGLDTQLSLRDAAKRYLSTLDKRRLYAEDSLTDSLGPFVLEAAGRTPRFTSCTLAHAAERFDEEHHEQFAALCVGLPDGSAYVAFRGTDGQLVSWREDFELSFSVTCAQRDATAYLGRIAAVTDGPLRVGGHSKGGNLAAFAVMSADKDVRERVVSLDCFDSPGFCQDVVGTEALVRLREMGDRAHLLVPRFCLIGNLLDHPWPSEVVESEAEGLLQHALTSWQVGGTRFVRAQAASPESLRFADVFAGVVARSGPKGCRLVTDSLFDLLGHAGLSTFDELMHMRLSQVVCLVRELVSMDLEAQEGVEGLLSPILSEAARQASSPVQHLMAPLLGLAVEPVVAPALDPATPPNLEERRRYRAARTRAPRLFAARLWSVCSRPCVARSVPLIAYGVLIMANADMATPALVWVAALVLAASGASGLHHAVSEARQGTAGAVGRAVLGAALVGTGILVAVLRRYVFGLANVLLGAALVAYGVSVMRRHVGTQPHTRRDAIALVCGLFGVVLGLLLAAHPIAFSPTILFASGIYVAAKGMCDLVFLRSGKGSGQRRVRSA